MALDAIFYEIYGIVRPFGNALQILFLVVFSTLSYIIYAEAIEIVINKTKFIIHRYRKVFSFFRCIGSCS